MIRNDEDIPPPSYESIHPNVYTRTTGKHHLNHLIFLSKYVI